MWKLPYTLCAAGRSDVGLVRENNEDSYEMISDLHFYLLADGMGGHNAGEVASEEALRFTRYAFEEYIISHPPLEEPEKISQLLRKIMQEANEWIYHLSSKYPAFKGMGTTICSALFYDEFMIHAHVGDSRVYCFREEKLSLLTRDHSLQNEMTEMRTYLPPGADPSQYKNILTRALGTSCHVDVEIKARQVLPGDLFLLCSDGLSDYVGFQSMIKILSSNLSLEKKTQLLIESAKEKGGSDNITLILIQILHNHGKNLFR